MLGVHRRGVHENEVASVYAVIAFEMGYLSLEGNDRLQRLLSADEFDAILETAADLARVGACIPEDVIERFGEPSIRWGTNDNYPCTMLYLSPGSGRYLHFDFWAEWHTDESGIFGNRSRPSALNGY